MKRIILTGALAVVLSARSGADRPGEGVHQDDPGVRAVRLRAGRCAALGEAAVRDGHADGCRPGGRVTAPPAVLPPPIRAEVRAPRRRHVLHPGGKGDVHGRRMHPRATWPHPGLVAAAANVGLVHASHQLGHGQRPPPGRREPVCDPVQPAARRPAVDHRLAEPPLFGDRRVHPGDPVVAGRGELDGLLPALPRPEP